MNIKTQYLENKKKWTAFTTIQGLDIFELGHTEKEAIEKLTARILDSKFLSEGLTMPE